MGVAEYWLKQLHYTLMPPNFFYHTVFTSKKKFIIVLSFISLLTLAGWGSYLYAKQQHDAEKRALIATIDQLQTHNTQVTQQLSDTSTQLEQVVNEDQFQKNKTLQENIKSIEKTFAAAVTAYDNMLKLKNDVGRNQKLESTFSKTLSYLVKLNYSSASAELATLNSDIQKYQQEAAIATAVIPQNVPQINEAPGSGYRQQTVKTDIGSFVVDVLAADLNSTRVQVETASAGDCGNECPVASLGDFVARSGGYAGINGPYFCPAEYPSCAGKTNSFDTLLMNKSKIYFNSANNVYSTVPAVIFSGSSARFVGQSLEWGRDTGVDAVIAAQPMVLSGGNVAFGGDGDPKKGSRGSRSFIGAKDNIVYIGIVRGATVAEVGHVLKAMGLSHALNLDSGGSVALYANGRYVAGPGRQTPFGIVLVRK